MVDERPVEGASEEQDFTHPGTTLTAKPAQGGIPNFEGQEVAFTKGKITSAANLEIDDSVFRLDDIVQVLVETRVTGIDHKVNERSGKMERIHTFKAIEAIVLPEGTPIEALRTRL